MLYRGILATELSGSLDGIVWSHNRGGPYARNRTIPTNPATPEQDAIRSALSNSKALWDALTSDQRAAWYRYSRSAPRVNRIGSSRPAGGWPEFFRANSVRLQTNQLLGSSLPDISTPPSAPTDTEFGPITLEIQSQTTGEILVTWADGTQGWQPEAGAALLIWLSDNKPLTVNFFSTPYTLRTAPEGDNGITSWTFYQSAANLPIPNDRHIFWRARTTRADGRLSLPQHGVLVT